MNTFSTDPAPAKDLPKSVRGAPAELRRLIRKRQNSESAKRCRLRRKLEAAKETGTQLTTAQRLENLEKIVAQLNEKLSQTDNTIAKLLSQNCNPPPPAVAPLVLPHASPMNDVVPEPQPAAAPVMSNLILPAFPILSFSDDVPISPVTPTSPRVTLQIPEAVPGSPQSQHSMSDTGDFTSPTHNVDAENCTPKKELFEVGSPASEFGFVSSDVSLNNFSSDDDLFGSLDICTADNLMWNRERWVASIIALTLFCNWGK